MKVLRPIKSFIHGLRSLFFVGFSSVAFYALVALFFPLHWISPYWYKYVIFVFATKTICGIWNLLGVRTQIDRLKTSGPVLVISNHTHNFDTFILTRIVKIPSYVAKKSLKKFAVFDHFIFLDRNGNDMGFFKEVQDTIKRGTSVIIFPEGTRVKFGDHKPYSKSIALLARRLDVPIALMALNIGKIVRSGKIFPSVSFGKTMAVKFIEYVSYNGVVFDHYFDHADIRPNAGARFDKKTLCDVLKLLEKRGKVYAYLLEILEPWNQNPNLSTLDLDEFLTHAAPMSKISPDDAKQNILRAIAIIEYIKTKTNPEKDTVFTDYVEATIRREVDKLDE